MKKEPFKPLPQPKKTQSKQTKLAMKRMSEAKKALGIRGKTDVGDLINKSKTLKVAVMGLV